MNSSVTRRDLELISKIYDAAIDPGRWPQIMENLVAHVGADGGAIFAADENFSEFAIEVTTSIWTPRTLDTYRRRFHAAESPLYQNLNRFPPRQLLLDDQILDGICVASELPARRWLASEMGITHRAAARLQKQNIWFDVMVLQYKDNRPMRNPSVLHRTNLFMDHLAKVVEINRPFMILKQRYNAVLSALDRYQVGVFVLNDGGEVIVRNSAADRALDNDNGLSITSQNRLRACRAEEDGELAAGIARAVGTASARDNRAETLLVVSNADKKHSVLLDICPASDAGRELDSQFKGAFVFAVDPLNLRELSVEGMNALYRMTAAETDVLRCVVKGLNVSEIAEHRGVSVETVRSQVKSILGKVGVRDKSQLVSRVASVNIPIN